MDASSALPKPPALVPLAGGVPGEAWFRIVPKIESVPSWLFKISSRRFCWGQSASAAVLMLQKPVPFGPGWWAFSFPYAATVAYALQLLSVERVSGVHAWTWALIAFVTAAAAALGGRTVIALVGDRFLLPVTAPTTAEPVGTAPDAPVSALDHGAPERPGVR